MECFVSQLLGNNFSTRKWISKILSTSKMHMFLVKFLTTCLVTTHSHIIVAYETLHQSRNSRKLNYFWLLIVKGTQGNQKYFWYTFCPLASFYEACSNHCKNAEILVKAKICLHNFLRQTNSASYCPTGFVGSWDKKERSKRGNGEN